ncbi:hypothetical protein N781_00900 [Pontibacillus halophilus JSM 076056 = DSM 19796]|uniref:N-acetyltransferase domain-containing protein n=1 Tax=Pontibacillus halophilus JSM 076056 = DSM 19796 TaxID=1385510 RepID=A0A0A5IE16_9BACI|nr:GNAT family N-acetyltransferase [Pontibacillus halophilus]KGX94062.1 hypothetical protein N781_00900 [Pontibacillus halophilus JSM 076056 = DSM 19796]
MTVFTYNCPNQFLSEVEPFFLVNEALHNLPMGVAMSINHDASALDIQPFLGHLSTRGIKRCILMRTKPSFWIMATNDELTENEIEELVLYFKANNLPVGSVIGDPKNVERFAQRWCKELRATSTIHMNQWVYVLNRVRQDLNRVDGELLKATPAHSNLIKEWLVEFGDQANEQIDHGTAQYMAEKYVERESVRLFHVGGEPVSMINQTRSTRNGCSVNGVFTPDKHKQNGYATASVTALSEEMLQGGYQFCCLYTDKDNIYSNRMYQNIGYEPIGESVVIRFDYEHVDKV